MICPKCNSPLRPSKQKEGYFLCDTCHIRMSLEYINKHSSETDQHIYSTNNKIPGIKKKKYFPIVLILLFLLIGCLFLSLHFGLYEKIKTMISPSESSATLTESIDFHMLDYKIVSEDITPKPAYGHEYLLINVQITNNSPENLSVDSLYNFEGYVDNKKLPYCTNSEDVLTNLEYIPLSSELLSNESITGYLCFELPVSWATVEIHYAPVIWSSTDLVLQLEKKVP